MHFWSIAIIVKLQVSEFRIVESAQWLTAINVIFNYVLFSTALPATVCYSF